MSEENVDLVRRGYELFAAGDLQGVADLFAPEAQMPAAGGLGVEGTMGVYRGPEGMLAAMREGIDAFDDFRVDVEEIVEDGDAVMVTVAISGRGRASGLEQTERLVHLWILHEGKVVHGEVHRTTEEALQAARRDR
jgi:ketosteroid isomerase-like protein